MSKDLKAMTDAELRKHIKALEKKVYQPLWSPVNKYPDGYDDAAAERNRRVNKANAEDECVLAELRAKAEAARLQRERDKLTIRGIREYAPHELNNEN